MNNRDLEVSRNLGEKIKSWCRERNLTQMELANRIGLSRSSVNSIINGKWKPKRQVLKKIAQELEIPILELVEEPKETSKFLGHNIRVLCRRNRMNYCELAKKAGISTVTISHIVNGKNSCNPSKITIRRLAKALNSTVEVLENDKLKEEDIYENVARNLKILCEFNCLMIAELATLSGASISAIQTMLNSKNALISEDVDKVAIALGVTTEDLMYDNFQIEAKWISRANVTDNLLRLCEETGATLITISKQTGITCRTLDNIINGRNLPTIRTIKKIAEALKVEPQRLMNLSPKHQTFNFEKQEN